MIARLIPLFVIFALFFVVFATFRLPLSTVVPINSLSAQHDIHITRAEGTLWRGRLAGTRVQNRTLGDIELELKAAPLLLGRIVLKWSFAGGGMSGYGEVSRGLGGQISLKSSRLTADLTRFALPDGIAARMLGNVRLEARDVSIHPRDGCRRADASLLIVDPAIEGYGQVWNGPNLEGGPRCENGALIVPLAGAEGAEKLEFETSLDPALQYRLRARIETERADVAQVMPILGFEEDSGGYDLVLSGSVLELQ